ncbi:unnamed protein product [Urochloa decumbens]|uniref:F-box domain-containing protein n=1 Tax=Urochloa decumbens TaxID=240449 RepID=A0ABC9FMS0_9POAL
MPPPELIDDDAMAEILLRLPPDDPACLVRASLVCKPWRRIASSAAFLRRYRRFHRSPPPLAFIAGLYFLDPTAATSRSTAATAASSSRSLRPTTSSSGTPSPAAGTWCPSPHRVVHRRRASYVTPARGTLVGDAMYFVLGLHNKILKYNFAEHCLSVIHPPEVYDKGIVLMVTEDGLLGLSGIRDFNLYLWSREADAEGVEWWVQTRMIDLQRLLPVDNPFNPVERAVVTGFAEGACVIFVSTDIGGFVIELKTGRVRKVAEPGRYYPVIPFISFCTPGFPIDIGKMCSGSN